MRTVLILSLCLSLSAGAGLARAQAAPPATVGQLEEVELPNPSKRWAWGVGGAALGLWLLAAGTGGGALAIQSSQEGNPSSPTPYTQDLADQANTGKSLATAAYVFMGLAGITTIVAAVMFYECYRKPRKGPAEAPKRTARIQFTGTGVQF